MQSYPENMQSIFRNVEQAIGEFFALHTQNEMKLREKLPNSVEEWREKRMNAPRKQK